MACLAPNVAFGDLVRTCLPTGEWSSPAPICHAPNPCVSNPCIGEARCVVDQTVMLGYRCVCINGASGTPGVDGMGCITPSIDAVEGTVKFAVSDLDDVVFAVGRKLHSILSLDERLNDIQRPGGFLDTHVNATFSDLSVSLDESLDSADATVSTQISAAVSSETSTTQQTLAAIFESKQSSAKATNQADLSTRAAAVIDSATLDAVAKVSAAQSQSLSQAQKADIAALSTAQSATEAMRVQLSTQASSEFLFLHFLCLCSFLKYLRY